MKHGAYSARLVAAKAEELRSRLLEPLPPWLLGFDARLIDRFLRAEARALMLNEYTERLANDQGVEAVPMALWETAVRADVTAINLAARLGLSRGSLDNLISAGKIDELSVHRLKKAAH